MAEPFSLLSTALGFGKALLTTLAVDKTKKELAQGIRSLAPNAETAPILIVERHVQRAYLKALQHVVHTARGHYEQGRAAAVNKDYGFYQTASDALAQSIKALNGRKWQAALRGLSKTLPASDPDDLPGQAKQHVRHLMTLPADTPDPARLSKALAHPRNGFQFRFALYMADEILHGDPGFHKLYAAQQAEEQNEQLSHLREELAAQFKSFTNDNGESIFKAMQGQLSRIEALVTPPALMLDLYDAGENTDITQYLAYSFESAATAFTGRAEEIEQLSAFLHDERPLLWWQVAGEGGQGKSRLALEVAQRQQHRWHAGFLRADAYLETDWRTVPIDRPTLIIIDYIADPRKAEKLPMVLNSLATRMVDGASHPVEHDVRILVLERAPFAGGEAGLRPSWHAGLSKPRDQLILHKHVFLKESALILADFSDDRMITIANSWRQHSNLEALSEAEEKTLISLLRGNETNTDKKTRAWRPLFAMLFATKLDQFGGKSRDQNMLINILEQAFEQERQDYWLDQDGHALEPSSAAQHLAAFATMAGECPLPSERFEDGFYGTGAPQDIRDAWMLCGYRVEDDAFVKRVGGTLHPIKARTPDLLGEFLILWLFGQYGNIADQAALDRILTDASKERPGDMIAFLIRMQEDFARHFVTTAIQNSDAHLDNPVLALLSETFEAKIILVSALGLTQLVNRYLEQDANANQVSDIGTFPLLMAAQEGHTKIVEMLLQAKAEPNTINAENGTFPLLQAAQNGHTEVARLLLKAKAEPNRVDRIDGTFPLLMAAQEGHTEVARLLLNAKAEPNQIHHKDGTSPLLMAAQEGHTEVARLLLKAKANPNTVNSKSGNFALLMAAQNGHTEIVDMLLLAKAEPNTVNTENGTFPLLQAAQNGHTEIVDLLLLAKAEPNTVNAENGSFPLLMAAQNGHTEVARLLLKAKANPNTVSSKSGNFPLLMAAQEGHTEIVDLLLQAKAEPNTSNAENGTFPLLMAAQDGHTEIVDLLLLAKAEPNTVNPNSGSFPLLQATQNGHTEIVDMLLKAKANPNTVSSKSGNFPLLMAAQEGHTEIVEMLLKAKAEPNTVKTENGTFPLMLAAQDGHTEVVDMLLKAKAEPNAVNSKSGTFPLLMAAQDGHTEVVDMLLKAKANPNTVSSKSGNFPLLMAAQNGHTEIVEMLLKAKAEPNRVDPIDGTFPLLMAAQEGHTEIVEMLLKHGADKDQTALRPDTGEPITAAEIARSTGHNDIAELIENWPAGEEM